MSQSNLQTGFALITVVVFLALMSFALLLIREQSSALTAGANTTSERTQLSYTLQSALTHAKWELSTKGCSNYTNINSQLGSDAYQVAYSATSGSPLTMTLTGTLANGTSQNLTKTAFQSYGSTTLTEIEVNDAVYLQLDRADDNRNSNPSLIIKGLTNKTRNLVVQADLSSIPGSARIDRAELVLNVTTVPSEELLLQRVTKAWIESEVTWNERINGTNWWTPGGSTSSTIYSRTTVTSLGPVAFDLTALVAEWQAGADNYGLMLSFEGDSAVEAKFDSDETNPLTLRVYHSCECGESCAIDNNISCDANIRPNSIRNTLTSVANDVTGITGVTENLSVAGFTFPAGGGYIVADSTKLYAYDNSSNLLGECDPNIGADLLGLSYITSGSHTTQLAVLSDTSPKATLNFVGTACSISSSTNLNNTTLANATGVAFLTLPSGEPFANHFAIVDNSGKIEIVSDTYALVQTIDANPLPGDAQGIVHIPNQARLLVSSDANEEVFIIAFDGTVEERYDFTRFGFDKSGGLGINLDTCDHLIANGVGDDVSQIFQLSLSKQPIAHWKLNEQSGNVAVDSIGGHDGTFVGSPVWSAAGAVQGALQMSPGNSVFIADDPALHLPTEVSVSGWIYAGVMNFYHPILAKGFGNQQNFWLGIANGNITVVYHDGSPNEIWTAVDLTIETWHHLAYSYSTVSGQLNLYVDGALVLTEPAGGTLTTSTAPVHLGTSDSGGNLVGRVDDVYLFDSEISAADVALLYAEGLPSASSSPPPPSPPDVCVLESYADNLDVTSFSGDDGSLPWTDPWIEVGESDGPDSGDVRVKSAPDGHKAFRIRDNNNGGEGVRRLVDLTNFADATLSFEFQRFNMAGDEFISIRIIQGDTETEIGRIEGSPVEAWETVNYPLTPYLGATAQIKFITSANMGNNSGAHIDTVSVGGCLL